MMLFKYKLSNIWIGCIIKLKKRVIKEKLYRIRKQLINYTLKMLKSLIKIWMKKIDCFKFRVNLSNVNLYAK